MVVPRQDRNQENYSSIIVYVDPVEKMFTQIDVNVNLSRVSSLKSYSFIVDSRKVKSLDNNWSDLNGKFFLPNGSLVAKYKEFAYKELIK